MLNQWQRGAHDGLAEKYFDQDGRLIRQVVEDVAPTIDHATRVRNDLNGNTPGGMRQIGSVPRSIWNQWMKEWRSQGLPVDTEPGLPNALAKCKLRDRDFSKFRTTDAAI